MVEGHCKDVKTCKIVHLGGTNIDFHRRRRRIHYQSGPGRDTLGRLTYFLSLAKGSSLAKILSKGIYLLSFFLKQALESENRRFLNPASQVYA